MESAKPRIQVIVRKRPLSEKEQQAGESDIMTARGTTSLVVAEHRTRLDLSKYVEEHEFVFDGVFSETATNQGVYQECLQPLVNAAFEGSRVTVFAYGQTGSGKTYTMMGEGPVPGLYLNAANDLFAIKGRLRLVISFFEIYCGKLFDLLNERLPVQAREDGKQQINLVGLSRVEVESVEQLMELIGIGMTLRKTGQTGANEDSSRSHAILEVSLRDAKAERGKMTFIDLAGCERGADVRDTDRQTRIDGAEINKSLLALKECIRAMDQDKQHTPFRGSKLTQVLKDSFVGNCKTLMIANVSPASSCCEYTLNTLRYADRVKELKNEKKDEADPMMLPRNKRQLTRNQSENGANRSKLKQPTPTKILQPTSLNTPQTKIGRPTYKATNYRQPQPNKEILKVHRRYLEEVGQLLKKEAANLSAAEKPTGDIASYLQSLRASIVAREQLLQDLKEKLEEYVA